MNSNKKAYAIAVPKASFLFASVLTSLFIVFIVIFLSLLLMGYRNIKKIILGSIIVIIGIFIAGLIAFPLTLILTKNTAVQTNPWTIQTTLCFSIGASFIFILSLMLGKFFFKITIEKAILFSILLAVLFNPIWFPSNVIEFSKRYYPGDWYNVRSDGMTWDAIPKNGL